MSEMLKEGANVSVKVEKVNQKTIIVRDSKSNIVWRVTASMVTKLGIGEAA